MFTGSQTIGTALMVSPSLGSGLLHLSIICGAIVVTSFVVTRILKRVL